MIQQTIVRTGTKWLLVMVLLGVALANIATMGQAESPAADPAGAPPGTFSEIAPQGFDDPNNNVSWAMKWWDGYLYVGTNRAWYCWSQWSLHYNFPFLFPYPPTDPDLNCLDPITDMDLRAEIWRWSPTTTWERVYQSPENVPIPGTSDFTARDVGFRSMSIWIEDDGTEALYVGSVYPKAINPDGYPPPRILRTEDGVNWEAIPQDPGTMMGDYDQASFRGIVTYNDLFFIVAATIQGSGPVWVTDNPSAGNDTFQVATPEDLDVFELIPYNGFLYVGTNDPPVPFEEGGDSVTQGDDIYGYTVQRTSATGTPPYEFEVVVDEGAYLEPPSRSVVSMKEFNGSLYVGTDKPAEMIRVHPDDSWELIVGTPRDTPLGPMEPLSGYDAGFNWPVYNIHIWRQEVFDDTLFVGTADQSTLDRVLPDPPDPDQYGYDLYYSDDGIDYYPITINGMGDQWQMGIRTFTKSDENMYYGTSSFWTGLRVYEMEPKATASASLYLPFVTRGGSAGTSAGMTVAAPLEGAPVRDYQMFDATRPTRLMVEPTAAGNLLSWDAPSDSVSFEIYRELVLPDPAHEGYWLPQGSDLLGTTTDGHYIDAAVPASDRVRYYVVAIDADGARSQQSNFVGTPLSAPAQGIGGLSATLQEWSDPVAATREATIAQPLRAVESTLRAGELGQARAELKALESSVGQALPEWRATDVEVLFHRLERRIWLAQQGLLSVDALLD